MPKKNNNCLTTVFSLLLSIFLSRLALAMDTELQRENTTNTLRSLKDDPIAAFESWRMQHYKSYKPKTQEWQKRYEIWLDNLNQVITYNEQHTSHWLTMTSLADLSPEEVKVKTHGFINQPQNHSQSAFLDLNMDLNNVPRSVDWRLRGAVTEVKDQGACGSCWAFSAVGSIEGANALVNEELIDLSVQELVDCDTNDQGCQGGFINTAFEWVIRNGGITSGSDYKYHGARHFFCNKRKARHQRVNLEGYQTLPIGEQYLIQALSQQPVSVAVQADEKSFVLYGGGVLDGPCGQELNHGMLAVGYDLDKGYFLLKNSWGENWGEAGYIRLAMIGEDTSGQCGVAMCSSYPIVESDLQDSCENEYENSIEFQRLPVMEFQAKEDPEIILVT